MFSVHPSLVQGLAKKFKNRGIPYEDLVQVVSLGLGKAIRSFDRRKGAEFTTFAAHCMVGEIKHHFRDNGWHLRSPSISEIAEEFETSEEEVIEVIYEDITNGKLQ